jgi:hypothetical protein
MQHVEGGIWPAAEPSDQVWPFLGEHLKGSWQRSPNANQRRLLGSLETLQGGREEFQKAKGFSEPPI